MRKALVAGMIVAGVLAASISACVAAPKFGVYTVKPGDTLWSMSRRFNTTPVALQQLNPGVDPLKLRFGQEIKVGQAALESFRHIVKPGETLYSIARGYGTSVALLADINGLANPNRLRVGQALAVYAKVTFPAEGLEYVVKRGDTLYAIAKRFYITTAELVEANRLANPNRLAVGQRLIIPL